MISQQQINMIKSGSFIGPDGFRVHMYEPDFTQDQEMNVKMKKPCSECPFRKNNSYLRPQRCEELAEKLRGDDYFICHKTLKDNPQNRGRDVEESMCAGSLIVMSKEGILYDNLSTRIAMAFGDFDPDKMQDTDEVYDSFDDFVEGHNTKL